MKMALILLALATVLHAQEGPCVASAELQRIYDADQADRETESIDWEVVNPRDEARRSRVTEILEADAAKLCPEDFHNAAMIFQHGREAPHYLMAHVLASIAAARGHEPSRWMMAATLDRYLRAIEQPQVFGTQYYKDKEGPWNQGEFDRSFLTESLRTLFNVPSLQQQRERLDRLDATGQP